MNDVIIDNGKPIGIIHEFKVYYHGWECDPWGWVVEQGGERFVVMTDHGDFYRADKNHLDDRILDYMIAIEETEKAIALL